MDKEYQIIVASDKLNSQIAGEIARVKTLTKTKDKDIAEKIGKSKSYYSAMLVKGIQKIGTIEAIANAMGYEVEVKFVKKGE